MVCRVSIKSVCGQTYEKCDRGQLHILYSCAFSSSHAVLGNVIQNCRTDENRTSLRFSETREL